MTMKEIRAIVRPARVAALREALRAIPNFPGVTLWRAEGFTAPAAIEHHSVREELAEFSDKVMLSVIADEAAVPLIRRAIFEACRTGQIGDGLVWVVDIGDIHRIRDATAYRPPGADEAAPGRPDLRDGPP
jgi:nitrogen regulatory protein P-II 1